MCALLVKTRYKVFKREPRAQAARASTSLSKAARGRPEGPTERSVFKIIFVMLAVLWLTFLGGKRNENVT